jgi:hypothetical protein
MEFRELLYRMTARDLMVRYKQSVMGFGWAIVMPLVNTLLFTVLFTRVARLEVDVPYPIFAYTGLLFWNCFASSLRFSVNSLSSNKILVSKVYFPREIFPFSAIMVSLVDLAVGCIEPMEFYHAYKLIFLCSLLDGEPRTSYETLAVDFFDLNDLPPLSSYRTNDSMLQEVFAHVQDPQRPTAFD